MPAMFLGLEYYMEKLEVINIDSTKAFIRDDRRVDTKEDKYWGKYYPIPFMCQRKTPHDYSDTKELCLLIENVEYLTLIDVPLKLNDVVVLGEPWGERELEGSEAEGYSLYLDQFLKSDYQDDPDEWVKEFNWQPFSTMPPHLGKCVQIIGEPRVELVHPHIKLLEKHNLIPYTKDKKYFFIYPIKEVS
jgi:hypothetical protein